MEAIKIAAPTASKKMLQRGDTLSKSLLGVQIDVLTSSIAPTSKIAGQTSEHRFT
jgi:hypothetical protein